MGKALSGAVSLDVWAGVGGSHFQAGIEFGLMIHRGTWFQSIERKAIIMAQVKVGSARISIPDKIQYARQIVLDMTGNANFTTPAPTLPSLAAAATALEAAYNAAQTLRQAAKSKTAIQNTAEAALDVLCGQLGNYVENTSGGDAAKIISSGFNVKAPAAPVGDLPAPDNVSITPSTHPGAVDMKWKRVRGARCYLVSQAADSSAPLDWSMGVATTKAKAAVNTMTSGGRYWFRVAAVGAAGQGAWSDAVSKIAP